MNVRTSRTRAAAATATLAPARSIAPVSAGTAPRQPAVVGSATTSTSTGPLTGGGAPMLRGGDGSHASARRRRRSRLRLFELPRARLEAGRAQQLDRLQRRGALDVVAHAVALLDRSHGRVLATPGQRPDDREAGRDRGDLREHE